MYKAALERYPSNVKARPGGGLSLTHCPPPPARPRPVAARPLTRPSLMPPPQVLRAYGRFTEDIKADPWGAARYHGWVRSIFQARGRCAHVSLARAAGTQRCATPACWPLT